MMRTTAEGGFSTTNMVNFNSNSGNKLRSVKNYSPKNVYELIKLGRITNQIMQKKVQKMKKTLSNMSKMSKMSKIKI